MLHETEKIAIEPNIHSATGMRKNIFNPFLKYPDSAVRL